MSHFWQLKGLAPENFFFVFLPLDQLLAQQCHLARGRPALRVLKMLPTPAGRQVLRNAKLLAYPPLGHVGTAGKLNGPRLNCGSNLLRFRMGDASNLKVYLTSVYENVANPRTNQSASKGIPAIRAKCLVIIQRVDAVE